MNVDTSRSYHSLRNNVFPRMFDVRFIPCKHRWPIMMTATWVYGNNPQATVNRCTFNKSSKSISKYFSWHFWRHQKITEKFSNILFRQKMSEFGIKNSRKLVQVKLCHTIRPNPKMSEKVFKNITKTNRIQKCQQIRSRPKFSFGKFLTFFLTFSDDFLLSWYRFLTFLNFGKWEICWHLTLF